MNDRRRLLAALAAAAGTGMLGLSGCGGGQAEDSDAGHLRLVNLSNGYSSLDLYVDDSRVAAGVAAGAASGYASVAQQTELTAAITAAGGASNLVSAAVTLANAQSAALVAWGWAGGLQTTLIDESLDAADSGKTRLRILNLAPDAGVLDVFLTGSTDALSSATAVAASLEADALTDAVQHSAGTWRVRVTAEGDRTDLRLDVDGLVLGSTEVATLVLTPGSGGVLVDAHLLVQGGGATTLANTQGRARVVASVESNGSVAVSLAGTTLTAALTSPAIGSFQRFTAGSGLPLVVTVGGVAVTVAAQDLPAGGDYTVLVWGSASAPQVQVITEDLRLPDSSTQAAVRVLHAVNGLTTGLTLTVDFSAVVDNVLPGTVSDWAALTPSSAMRMDLTAATSTTSLYSVTDLSLLAGSLYTLFVLGDAGSPLTALRRER